MTALAWRRVGWNHPEFGAAIYAAAAWALLVLAAADAGATAHAEAHRALPPLADGLGWSLMCVAMMVPSALLHARHLALGGRWERRQRTVAIFLGTYLSVWLAFGVVALAAAALVRSETDVNPSTLVAIGLIVAAVWALSPRKWRALRACHMIVPLPPHGSRADVACASAGFRYGRLCLIASWPLMAVMAIAGHGAVLLMAVASIIVAAEKVAMRPIAYRERFAALLIGAAAVVFAI